MAPHPILGRCNWNPVWSLPFTETCNPYNITINPLTPAIIKLLCGINQGIQDSGAWAHPLSSYKVYNQHTESTDSECDISFTRIHVCQVLKQYTKQLYVYQHMSLMYVHISGQWISSRIGASKNQRLLAKMNFHRTLFKQALYSLTESSTTFGLVPLVSY